MFHLRKVKYKDILDIKDLSIPKGEVTCIVGESGSGKTTLLRLLNKLASPDSGEILYADNPLAEMDSVELRRKVVMLSQAPAVFPGTIAHNLQLGLTFAGLGKASPEDMDRVMALVSLKKDLDGQGEKLSGGEQQRLALARLMLIDPEIMLLDEPSAALDEDTEITMIAAVINYAREKGKTVVMVTHAKTIARAFGDNIITITQGQILTEEGK